MPDSDTEFELYDIMNAYEKQYVPDPDADTISLDVPEGWCADGDPDVFFLYGSIPEGGTSGDIEAGTVQIQFQTLAEQVPFAAHIFPKEKFIARYALNYYLVNIDSGLGRVGGPGEYPGTSIDYGEPFILKVT